VGEVNCPRRYYLLKAYASRLAKDGLEQVWRAKQEALPGTPLATETPSRARLVAAGYTTIEDLTGADVAELQRNAGLSHREALWVLPEGTD
jgi:hypothetical protein